jgi:hypothetical protein
MHTREQNLAVASQAIAFTQRGGVTLALAAQKKPWLRARAFPRHNVYGAVVSQGVKLTVPAPVLTIWPAAGPVL